MKKDNSNSNLPPWVIIVLKVIVYAAGLLAAGYGVQTAATRLM